MAWLLGDGFDFYGATADLTQPGTVWDNTFSTAGALNVVTTRFGAGCAENVQNGVSLASFAFANSTTIYVNFAFDPTVTIGTGTAILHGIFLVDGTPIGANIQTGVCIRNNGDIVVVSNSTLTIIATSPKFPLSIIQNVWTHYQIKIVINNTTGSVEVRFNGNTVADWLVTGLNTRSATTNNFCNRLYTFSNTSGAGIIDDLYAFNDQGAQPNTWQGDVRAVQQMPSADNSVSWTPDSGSSRFSRVNEVRQNGDTSYVSTSTIANVDQYNVSALPIVPLAIIAAQTKMYVRMDDAGPHQVKSRLISGATTLDSATLTLSTNYQWLQQVYTVDPNTSASWSAAGINAVTIGPVDVL